MSKKTPEICKCGARLHPMKKFRQGATTVFWCSGCDRTRTITEFRTLQDYLDYRRNEEIANDRRGG
jgi:hypothetical protein